MSPKNSKLSNWANGDEPDAQNNTQGKRLNQWASGEAAAPNKTKASIINRLGLWAVGEEYTEAAAQAKPKNAPAAPKPTPTVVKPTAAKPAPAPSKPTPTAARPTSPQPNANSENGAELAGRLAELQTGLALTDLNRQIQEAQKVLKAASAALRECRTRGYIFQKNLEANSIELEKQASDQRTRFDEQVRALKAEAGKVEALLAQGAGAAKGALVVLENKIQAAGATLKGDCQSLTDQTGQFNQTVKTIIWMLNQVEQASFQLTATESLVNASQAIWKNGSGGNDIKGILYLTDLRLIFERKDERVTKKILFVPTETEKLQNLEWEAPIQLVEKAVSSQQGLLGLSEQIAVRFAVGGPFSQVTLQLDGSDETTVSSDDWAASIGRVKSGMINQDRTTPFDPKTAQAAKLPSNCPSCGAVFTQTVLRGQTEIKCQYCGLPVRL